LIKDILRRRSDVLVSVANFCAKRALFVIFILGMSSAVVCHYVIQNAEVNSDTSEMLSPSLEFRQNFKAFKAAMPAVGPSLVVVIEAPNPDQAEDAARLLSQRLRNTEGIKGPVKYLAADPFFANNGLLYLKRSELDELANRLSDAQPLLASLSADPSLRGLFEILSLALQEASKGGRPPEGLNLILDSIASVAEARAQGKADELSWRRLISGGLQDVGVAKEFIRVGIDLDFSGLGPARKSMDLVRKVAEVAALTPEHGVSVRITGGDAMSTEELASVSEGAAKAGWISLIVVTLLLFLALGSLRLVIATLLTLVTGLVFTAGFAIAFVGYLNLISVAFAVLFIGLGVDFGIHFALRFREEIVAGKSQSEALTTATQDLGGALTLCAVAAAIGFFSFLPTNYSGLSELGLISGVGMFIALVANFTLLPALLSLLPFKSPLRPSIIPIVIPNWIIYRFGGKLAVVAVFAGVTAAAFLPQARFDFNPLHLKDPTTESVRTAIDLMADPAVSPETISVLIDRNENISKIIKNLTDIPEVDRVVWLDNFVPSHQDEKVSVIQNIAFTMFSVFDPASRKDPPGKEELKRATGQFRQHLLATASARYADPLIAVSAERLAKALIPYMSSSRDLKRSVNDLQDGLLARLHGRLERLKKSFNAAPFSEADIPSVLRGRYVARDGRLRLEIFPKDNVTDNSAMKRFVYAVSTQLPKATDTPVVLVRSGSVVMGAIIQATVTAMFFICALLVFVLRNFWDAVLVLLPLALAALWTVAASVILDWPFNYANVIVVPLLLGLGVASGTHLVMRSRLGLNEREMLKTSTPRAVVFSALTTIGSFGSLAISDHRGTASMGELLMVAIGFTLISTLVILPSLMGWLNSRGLRPTRWVQK